MQAVVLRKKRSQRRKIKLVEFWKSIVDDVNLIVECMSVVYAEAEQCKLSKDMAEQRISYNKAEKFMKNADPLVRKFKKFANKADDMFPKNDSAYHRIAYYKLLVSNEFELSRQQMLNAKLAMERVCN